jgi:hypothetical protein
MTSPDIPQSRSSYKASFGEPLWPLYAVLFASFGIVTGLIWDISWHRSIGRDTFFSPPHVLEQVAALVAGLSCGYVVLRNTFSGSRHDRARTVRFWGFHGALGMWVCIWGTLMMLVSAPFDDWWHNAYGLDVKIISPPHMVLAWGMIAIQIGAMLTVLARQNRASNEQYRQFGFLYICSAALLLTMHATVLMEEAAFPHTMHGARFYQVTAIFFPLALVALAIPSRLRWPATTAAAIYMGIVLVLMWVLQLMPAQPMLSPIFNAVTHMVPHPFPLLLVAPAVAIDVLLRRARTNDWKLAAKIGAVYVGIMVAVHWVFSEFLLSPLARNIVFGSDKWDYDVPVGDWRYEFWTLDLSSNGNWSPLLFFGGLLIAMIVATLSARAGFWLGNGMERIQR